MVAGIRSVRGKHVGGVSIIRSTQRACWKEEGRAPGKDGGTEGRAMQKVTVGVQSGKTTTWVPILTVFAHDLELTLGANKEE